MLYSLLGTPLGWVMYVLYLVVRNFGWAVILFTLIVKAASFPLTLKQQKNMAVSQLFTPRVQEIQKKYRGNQQKLNEEMQKLQKEGYNPVGGCGPMILTMIILFGVLDVVYKPMTHMERLDKEIISTVQNLSMEVEYTEIILAYEERDEVITDRLRAEIGEDVRLNLSKYTGTDSELPSEVKSELNRVASRYTSMLQRELFSITKFANNPEAYASLDSATKEKLTGLQHNMVFLGMNLGEVPQFGTFNNLWFIAAFCFIASVVQMIIQQRIQKATMPAAANMGSMKFMMFMGPAFSLIIVFSVPAGAGLYWAVSYIFMIAQSLIIFKFWPPEKMREEAAERVKAKLGGVDITAKVVDADDEGNEVVKDVKMSDMSKREQDEYFKKKLEEAREADRKKYGDDDGQLPADNEHESIEHKPDDEEG